MAGVKVLVTTDGSNLSDKAIDTAIDLTKQLGGELIGMTSVVGEAPTGGFEAEDAAVRDWPPSAARLPKRASRAKWLPSMQTPSGRACWPAPSATTCPSS